jgi:hypothetical protein
MKRPSLVHFPVNKAKEGFFMAREVPGGSARVSIGFRKVVDVFLGGEGLPFSQILSADRIERICRKHRCLFGLDTIYSTSVVLWGFLSQVLRDGKEAACQAAVARIVTWRCEQGLEPPTADTGDYCRARGKLAPGALRDISCEVADELEQAAEPSWLWKGRHHAKLVDGFTFTMPDTPANRVRYSQVKTQKPGLGQPIARAAAIVSLATGAIINLAFGAFEGKQSGETSLLRTLLGSFRTDDVVVMDRYYCSYMLLAMLLGQGTHACVRKHLYRQNGQQRIRRLGDHDHLVVWKRPERPKWMDRSLYQQIPKTLELREVCFSIEIPGYRTKFIEVITTLTDAEEYSQADIADLYGFRWNAELDIRVIKSTLNLDHVRCKSPAMVEAEVWATVLAYNLIRTTAAGAAQLHGKQPRQISFAATCQYVLAAWMRLACGSIDSRQFTAYGLQVLEHIASREVANRPGRIEPRAVKRRRDRFNLMNKPRHELRLELLKPTA